MINRENHGNGPLGSVQNLELNKSVKCFGGQKAYELERPVAKRIRRI